LPKSGSLRRLSESLPLSLIQIFFGVVAKDHINDCLYVYKRLREGKNDFVYLTTYTELVKNKEVRALVI